MLLLKEARVELLAILLVQFFVNCGSLALPDKGVCEEITPKSSNWLSSSWSKATEKETTKFLVCCYQYTYDGNLDRCVPVCSLGCINGTCTDVDTCTCTPPLILVGHTCVPSTYNCEHGDCLRPNDCRCHKGYMKSNDTCVPICNEVCVNGQCAEPNKCKCNDGYRADPNNTFHCNPICDSECVHGTCTARNKCTCNVGYEKTDSSSVCKPTCVGCEFGQCIAPNNCSCFEGYERINTTCKPKCSSCSNADCIAPEECRSPIVDSLAEEGYTPTCSPSCINGNCLIFNQCFCNESGYDLVCSVTCSHGYCTPPNNCTCKPKKKGTIFNF